MSHWLGSAGRNFAEQLSLVAIEHRGMSLRQTICWRVPPRAASHQSAAAFRQ
jgi:hypothetical protein